MSRTLRLHQAIVNTGRLRTRSLGKETVGAVALDLSGTVAAGASTGGVDVMLPGRVGDTPLIGCGVYADNEAGAVSMTGLGKASFVWLWPRKSPIVWPTARVRPQQPPAYSVRWCNASTGRPGSWCCRLTADSPFATVRRTWRPGSSGVMADHWCAAGLRRVVEG